MRSSVGDQQSAAAGKQPSRPAAGRSTASSGAVRPTRGLRELKKARTAAAIQRHAMTLFEANGYDATPVEAVAAAAEVAPSTVYRYFPTKEDLVISDEYDNLMFEKLAQQPAEASVVESLRGAFHEVTAEMSEADIELGRRRTRLMLQEPGLRGATLTNLLAMERAIADLVAERTGRDSDDPEIAWFTGAVIGIALGFMRRWAENPDLDVVTVFDDALDRLATGLTF
ncbi:TetR family transcriptional regulator [Nocardia cyriacigeorgica]|uniref:TetR family transcriptional regulator n=1 Tax=Nocardia cyriacigeorgica TaxID=135487 RepID=A0A5R8P6P7_9NOCA|nr:TetR family transcriptional regulator [Nocardia cyriacigeorgica]TLF97838.1 TetR family transcriptional regulator [Nocardia cyriacigeorgica]